MPDTPIYGWPFQSLSDPPDGASLGEDLALSIEGTLAAFETSLNTLISRANDADGSWTTFVGFGIQGSGSNPSLGDSVVTSRYKIMGGSSSKTILYQLGITIGSSFTAGSGTYEFLVPFAPTTESRASAVGPVWVNDSGTALLVGVCIFDSPTNGVTVFLANNTGAALGSGGPGTAWNTNDSIRLSIVFERT